MSLTPTDLQEIRTIVREEVRDEVSSQLESQLKRQLEPLQKEVQALRNDIKEIYDMIADMQKSLGLDKEFDKLSLEQKILRLNSQLIRAAKQAGIDLPR